jgi:Zn-dependent peptidase ImmA (M78 family)
MTHSAIAFANPELLLWARKTAGLDLATASHKIGHDEDRVRAWEEGKEQPTIVQLRKVASVYKRPLAVFYLPAPPADFSVLQDFRRFPNGISPEFSSDLRYLIRHVMERQEWSAEYRSQHGGQKIQYVGSEDTKKKVTEVAERARQLLGISLKTQSQWRNLDIALRNWIEAFERIGLLVFQSSKVESNEMRGFAIPNDFAPAVLINSKDTHSARIFTLFHEFAHILLAAGGVSNLSFPNQMRSLEQDIEIYCNFVAAEVLVPQSAFITSLSDFNKNRTSDIDNSIQQLSRHFAVSREVIARRLLDHNFISSSDYEERRNQYINEAIMSRLQRQKGEMKIPASTRVVHANGRQFTREVLAAYGDGEITARDLSGLLNVQLWHVPRIESAVFPARWKGASFG